MSEDKKKDLGAYHTPLEISNFLTKRLEIKRGDFVLEPSVGDGSFLFNAVKYTNNVTGIDIDSQSIKELEKQTDASLICCDFLNYANNNSKIKYDTILSNPPYLSFKKLTEEQRENLAELLKNNNIKATRQTNLWSGFVVACINMLKQDGKFAFVLPAEFLYSDYGKEVQEFIFKQSSSLTIIGFKELAFCDIQQDTILVYGRKGSNKNSSVDISCFELTSTSSLSDHENILGLEKQNLQKISEVTNINWKLEKCSAEFKKLYKEKFMAGTRPIMDVADIKIGLTTGANDIFLLTENEVKKYKLENYVKPLLRRASYVKSTRYNTSTFKKLVNKNKKTFLLDFNDKELACDAKRYIEEIEGKNGHKGYKLQNRSTWYKIPKMNIPDAFILRRVGEDARIISNDIKAMSTDNFHHIFLNKEHNIDELVVLSYTSIYRISVELSSRSYGGGALEILSSDFSRLMIPEVKRQVDYISIRQKIDEMLYSEQDIYSIVKFVDDTLVEKTGFSRKEMDTIYNEWQKMCKKRNNKR